MVLVHVGMHCWLPVVGTRCWYPLLVPDFLGPTTKSLAIANVNANLKRWSRIVERLSCSCYFNLAKIL